jgi:hypothetical protein
MPVAVHSGFRMRSYRGGVKGSEAANGGGDLGEWRSAQGSIGVSQYAATSYRRIQPISTLGILLIAFLA